MTTIYAVTADQILTATIMPKIASGNQNTVRLQVKFDSAWDGYAKSAVFYTSEDPTRYETVLSSDNICYVPPETLTEKGYLIITVKGVSSNGRKKSSTELKCKILPGTPYIAISDPSDDVYKQLLSAYGSANEAISKSKKDLEDILYAVTDDMKVTNASDKTEIENAIAVERARINSFVALANTNTTGDAELQDIRVDEYGNTHETAGEAFRETTKKKAEKTELNRFLKNDVFSDLDIAYEIGDLICNYKGGKWTNYKTSTFKLDEGDYTLIIPKLDIPSIGNACLEYDGGETDAKLRLVSPTKAGAYYFYHTAENAEKDIVFRVRISNETEPAYREYRAYCPIILRGNSAKKTIIPDYLTNLSVLMESKVDTIPGKNLFNKKSENIVYGYYLNGNGTTVENTALAITDYIPVEANTQYVASGYNIQAACVHFYNEYRQFIRHIQGYDIDNNCVTTPEKCRFIQWSFAIANIDNFQIEKGNIATDYEPYSLYQPFVDLQNEVKTIKNAIGVLNNNSNAFKAATETMSSGEVLTVVNRVDVKKNKTYIFTAKTSGSLNVRIAHGETEYGASYLDINDTTVKSYDVTSTASKTFEAEHGLNIDGFITVIVRVGISTDSEITIFTANGMYKSEKFSWTGCNGALFVRNNGDTLNDCSYSLTIGDIDSPIWVFGDSYLGLTNSARYPYYLLQMGFKNWLACGYPGGGSSQELESFKNLLSIAKPKYVVWCLGMNNGDNGAINDVWLTATETMISLCEKHEIKVILATIPSCGTYTNESNPVVVVDNSYKNTWVKESGYRYVDFEKAVIKDTSFGWYAGMLSGDGIHPTELGAKVLASRLMSDFPEITK